MNEIVAALFTIAAIAGVMWFGVMALFAYLNGDIDGELDTKYGREERANDHYDGLRRAIYEVAYRRGGERHARVQARRNERTGR